MPAYKVRPGAPSYGHAVGILLIDVETPFIPGDVGNASTYGYPVIYKTVPGVGIERLIEKFDPALTEVVVETARQLEKMGVRLITSDCGYMIHFQEAVARSVNVPVVLSSLLQLPIIENSLGPGRKIGVICARAGRLTEEMLKMAGLRDCSKVVVMGLEGSAAFRAPMLDEEPWLDSDKIEQDVVAVARGIVESSPEIGAILLECSDLPPYAAAVQRAVDRPVFDFITLIDYFHGAAFRKDFHGFY